MNLRSTKFALLLGAINGVLFAVAYQPVADAFSQYQNYLSRAVGITTVKIISPFSESLFLIFLFLLASYTGHRFLSTKIKSDIVLWQAIAIIATAVPSVVLYVIGRFNHFEFLPIDIDVEFALLFLGLAITINFFFGAVVAQLSKLLKG